MKNKVELLAPAGDKEKAYFALEYGADAVYLGAKQYSLRARSSNFEIEDIEEIVEYAHKKNKKVYLVTNIICHNFLLQDFDLFIEKIKQIKIDAFICADPFIITQIRKKIPNAEIHISTQQSITNSKASLFWKKHGATRVILSREMKLDEIELLCKNLENKIDVEMFIHGAVCISYSGRCMMSNNFSLRDSNVGGCAQSCRWEYEILTEPKIKNSFTMSAKDMVYIMHLEKLLSLNLCSFKIEGRMKTINYLSSVIKVYRKIIDDYYAKKPLDLLEGKNKLVEVANREIDDAFLIDANSNKMLYHDIQKVLKQNFAFNVLKKISNQEYLIISKNNFNIFQRFQIISPIFEKEIKILKMINVEQDREVTTINTPLTKAIIKLSEPIEMDQYCLGRIINE